MSISHESAFKSPMYYFLYCSHRIYFLGHRKTIHAISGQARRSGLDFLQNTTHLYSSRFFSLISYYATARHSVIKNSGLGLFLLSLFLRQLSFIISSFTARLGILTSSFHLSSG